MNSAFNDTKIVKTRFSVGYPALLSLETGFLSPTEPGTLCSLPPLLNCRIPICQPSTVSDESIKKSMKLIKHRVQTPLGNREYKNIAVLSLKEWITTKNHRKLHNY